MPIRLRIGEVAKAQGLTIKALAERAGVAYNTAHGLFTGRATRIDLDTLDRFCGALGVEPGVLFSREAQPEPARSRVEADEAPWQPPIGRRVRVIEPRLVHYRQMGTVAAAGESGGYYVHLDYDDERPETRVFFHAEELEAAPDEAPPVQRAAHWSTEAGLDRRATGASSAPPGEGRVDQVED